MVYQSNLDFDSSPTERWCPVKDRSGFRTIQGPCKRHVVTGPGGLSKTQFVEDVAQQLRENTKDEVVVYHVGTMMYEEDKTIPQGRILSIDPERLRSLRRRVMAKIIEESKDFDGHVIINTRAVFKWQYSILDPFGLDIDQLREFGATTFFTLIDNTQDLWLNFNREGKRHGVKKSLQEILQWREEEIRHTRFVAETVAGPGRFFLTATHSRDRSETRIELIARVMADPNVVKLYTSFPMTHVEGDKRVAAEIAAFKASVSNHAGLVYFDPADVDEFFLCLEAKRAKDRGESEIEVEIGKETVTIPVEELLALWDGINDAIINRDLLLVNQADITFALIPAIKDGLPALSSGVEAELNAARWAGRLIHICWQPDRVPSPFSSWGVVVHSSPDQFLKWLTEEGIIS